MNFQPDQLYHVYNQGNNRQRLFYSDEHYLYFLRLYSKFISGKADLLAYCLMPNHFHFLFNTNVESIKMKQVGSLELTELSNGIRMLLSSYAAAVNKQSGQSGSIFRQKTKAKLIDPTGSTNYAFICFNYIHQNPIRAQLVTKMEDWIYSSYRDYAGLREESLCNKTVAKMLIDYNEQRFVRESYQFIHPDAEEILFAND